MSTTILTAFVDATPASAATAYSSTAKNLGGYDSLGVVATLTGGLGGTLDVYLQTSFNGTEWYDVAHFAQQASSAAAVSYGLALTRSNGAPTIKVVGVDASPALSAGVVAPLGYGTQLRAVYVGGSGTASAGAANIRLFGYKNNF